MAAVEAAKAALESNLRQMQLQDAEIQPALAGIEQAQIAAAHAGKAAALADVTRTRAERTHK